MNPLVRILLLAIAAALLFAGGLTACGWAFKDANLVALGFFAACAVVVAKLP